MVTKTWKVEALKIRRILVLLSLLGLFSPLAQATGAPKADTPKLYNVELVIFQQNNPELMQVEHWPTTTSLTAPAQFITLNAIDTGATATMPPPEQAFTPIPPAQMQLNDAVQSLEKSSRYRVLMHIGWRQPGLDANSAIPIWIEQTLGENSTSTDPHTSPLGANPITTPSTAADLSIAGTGTNALAAPSPAQTLPLLKGTVRLHRSRYLHLSFDLDYIVPPPPGTTQTSPPLLPGASPLAPTLSSSGAADPAAAASAQQTGDAAQATTPAEVVFELKQHRRVRSGELNYFDHPAFGILALVTPYTPPAAQPAQTQTPGKIQR